MLLKSAGITEPFPAAKVEECIRDALKQQADTQAILRSPPADAGSAGASWQPEIDSLAVVEVICSIEKLLGVILPDSFAPRGGYDSIEECVKDLMENAQAVWVEAIKKEDEHA